MDAQAFSIDEACKLSTPCSHTQIIPVLFSTSYISSAVFIAITLCCLETMMVKFCARSVYTQLKIFWLTIAWIKAKESTEYRGPGVYN